MCYMRGLTAAEIENWTIGMLINYCFEYDRIQRRKNGEKVSDPEEQYRKLKALQPTIEEEYKNGRIDKEKYKSYIESLERWEKE